uniref:Uncharacterized protein n=1 Tax=Aegilops tauschii subsp. strangulata TaxID=200361 RepID=A0A453Q627_AEGTS
FYYIQELYSSLPLPHRQRNTAQHASSSFLSAAGWPRAPIAGGIRLQQVTQGRTECTFV